MNARASENYLAISRSSSASKSVEIFWAEIYWGRLFFRENYQTQLKITIIMGKNYCALKDCHNTAGMRGRFGKVVKLHHLPTGNRTLRSAWVRAISRKNSDRNKSITFSHTKSTQASWTHGLEIFTSQILI
jgi:hypothetical protein